MFYPADQTGKFAFPSDWRGLYIAAHGSWHSTNNVFDAPPRVAFVPITGDVPATEVDWSDPSKQWVEFGGGFQAANGQSRLARATGIAVGVKGSLFVSEDQNGYVLRVRPAP